MSDTPGLAPRARLAAVFRAVLGLVAIGFLVAAFLRTVEQAEGQVVPSPIALAGSFVLAGLGLWCGGRSWLALLRGRPKPRELTSAFFRAQAAKYIPGTLWQPVSLAASTRHHGQMSLPEASSAVVVHMIVQLGCGLTIGAGLALFTDVPVWIRIGALGGVLGPLVLKRELLLLALRLILRVLKKPDPGKLIPEQRDILRSFLWGLGSILAASCSFAVVLGTEPADLGVRVTGFAFAWALGFLAVPFPSGVGVREVVLISTFGPSVSLATVIAASGFHRAATIGAEAGAIIISTVRVRTERRRHRHHGSRTP